MDYIAVIAIDLVAACLLVLAVYFPRHRRRTLLTAYLGVNVGVLAVCLVLAGSAVGVGLGLGLFGVLSIIRLRSSEIEQHEVAYYFASLAIALVCGLAGPGWLAVGLTALILAVMYLGDHPGLFRRTRSQVVVLDQAFADEAALTAHLATVLGGRVRGVQVQRLDLVNDTTTVQVRFDAPANPRREPDSPPTRGEARSATTSSATYAERATRSALPAGLR